MEDVWKQVFAVGTEWDQYDSVYKFPWDFSHLDEALQEGGVLHDKKVYLFGCTEPQMLPWKGKDTALHVPAVVAVTSPIPPSEELGIKSVQMVTEQIVPMKHMKMGWVPLVPEGSGLTTVERSTRKAKVFALKCTQRRAGLRQLKEERVKKYEYCLPYVYLPHMQEDEIPDTVLSIFYTFEGETKPPLLTDFDWDMDDVQEFTEQLIQDEELPESEKEKFQEYLKGQIKARKLELKEAREKKKKTMDEMSAEKKDALKNMRFYKFYPKKSEDTPDTSSCQSPYINRYYGKATQVL